MRTVSIRHQTGLLFRRMLEYLIHGHSIGHPIVLSLFGDYLVRQLNSIMVEFFRRMLEYLIHGHSIGYPIVFFLCCDYLVRQFDRDRVVSANVGTPHSWPFNWTPN